jgi:hypothetical protein
MTKAKTPPSGQTSHVLGAEDEAEIEQHMATLRRGSSQAQYDYARARIAALRKGTK